MTWWLSSDLPRQFWVMKANSRCSIPAFAGTSLVPLAGAGWEMANGDRDPELVGEDLQFTLPQTQTCAVAATAIGVDQQPRRGGIASCAEFVPPAPDALDGEGGGIVIDAEIDPSGIGGDVVDAIGHCLAELRDEEVMHPDRLGLPLGAQFTAAVLEACPWA